MSSDSSEFVRANYAILLNDSTTAVVAKERDHHRASRLFLSLRDRALDDVMREYSLVLRVKEFRADARSIFLLALCKFVDLLALRTEEERSEASRVYSIDLRMMKELDDKYFGEVNWPCADPYLDELGRQNLMRKLWTNAPFWTRAA